MAARPGVAAALLIVATAGVPELHSTTGVMFWVVPSLNAPVAVNCCVAPEGNVGIAGVTAIETNEAEVTVTVVEPLTEPNVAVMLVLPAATLPATP